MDFNDKRVLIISIDDSEESFRQKENAELVKSAGGIVVSTAIQKTDRLHPKHYFGKGKLEYFSNVAEELDIDIVVVGEAISPAQISNIADFFDVPVIDRTMLILELFSQRATTNFGKLQVELALKEYMYPRLAGARKNMDRQAGVTGMRGKGEQKLELDRRALRTRILRLKEQIERCRSVEETKSKRRAESALPIVSLAGYSNTGKSTILNAVLRITGRDKKHMVYADDRLFATLDTSARVTVLPHGAKIILTDTVGLISDLPHTLIEAFSSTLGEIKSADLILNVIDSSSEHAELEEETALKLFDELGLGDKRVVKIYNKIDRMSRPSFVGNDSMLMSAKDDDDIIKLLERLETILFGEVKAVERFFSFDSLGELNKYMSEHKIISAEHGESGVTVKAYEYSNGVI